MGTDNEKCPNCGSEEFVSSLNSYDILIFDNSEFQVIKSELANIDNEIYCRECGEQVDIDLSEKSHKIQLKKSSKHSQ